MYAKYIKRILDLILSLMALIVLIPLMIIIGILVRINLGSPIIFKQKRPGKNEKIFTLYKFRTMTDKRDIDEINRRKKKNTCHPKRDELYSVNPNFNGIYSDEENR